MALEFSERVARIPPYPVAGGYGRQAPRVRLASNESPFGMLPGVEQAIADHTATLNRYPDPDAVDLRRRLAERHGVPAAQIAVGAGSCELLMLLGEALLEPGAEIVHAWPSFSVYPHLSAASGARAVTVPLDRQWRHDLPAMLSEITVATRIVIVCNPNNPTSTALGFEQLAEFIAHVPPQVCVLLDEAYCEYNLLSDSEQSIALLAEYPNLVLLRTFSKAYGLAGLRVGYALCGSTEVPAALDRVRQPFNSTALAQVAAGAALDAGDAVLERVAMTVAERIMVAERLTAMGLRVADSQANFCWVELGEQRDEAQIVAGLADRGVLVRAGAALGSDVPALRVTYGLPEEDESFLAALAEVLQM
jgi:histidinol-phosphate aminotransferase